MNKQMTKASNFSMKWAKFNFGATKRADLYGDLASFIKAGIPIYRALEDIAHVYRKRKNVLLPMIEDWLETMAGGKPFAAAINGWVPAEEVGLISGGDTTGGLQAALEQAAFLTRSRAELMGLLKSNLAYPVFTLVALFFFIGYISFTIVPQTRALMPPQYAPAYARVFLDFSDVFIHWGIPFVVALIMLFWFIQYTMPKWTGPVRDRFDGWFPWTFYREIQSGFFLISMSAMSKSGMTSANIVSDLIKYASPYIKRHLMKMFTNLERGDKEIVALDTGMLTANIMDRLLVYTNLPSFTEVMDYMGVDVMAMLKKRVIAISKALGNIMLVLIAAYVIWTVFSIGGIALAISDAIQNQGQGFK
jgi:type II secretory pathway component PulF